MSTYQAAPQQYGGHRPDPAPQRPRRPGTLLALLVTGTLSAVSGLVGAVLVFAGGKGLAEDNVKNVIDDHPDVLGLPSGVDSTDFEGFAGPLWEEIVSDRHDTLVARAGMVIFFAVLMLIFTLLARRAATWARVLITIVGVVSFFPYVLVVGDHEPTGVTALSFVGMLAGLVAVVCCWLPANQRYLREVRASR